MGGRGVLDSCLGWKFFLCVCVCVNLLMSRKNAPSLFAVNYYGVATTISELLDWCSVSINQEIIERARTDMSWFLCSKAVDKQLLKIISIGLCGEVM